MSEAKQGIFDMPMSEYLALPALSSGRCHTILSQSPMHAKMESDDANSEMDLGTYAHAMLLEGGHDGLVVIDADDWRTKAAKEARDAARAEGKTPILARKIAEVERMVKFAKEYVEQSEIAGIFESGKPEQVIIWHDGDTLCKARPDWLSDKYLLHFKTTKSSVEPRAFSRTAVNCGYDLAMMFYLRGLEAVQPDNQVQHFILAQEQAEPFACKLFDLSAPLRDVAMVKVGRAIRAWESCTKSGRWPAYSGEVHSIEITPWALAQSEEDMLTEKELEGGIPG